MRIDPNKLHRFGLVVLAAIVVLIIAISCSKQLRREGARGDVEVYVHAARLVLNDENIYKTPLERGKLYYVYLPLIAVLMIPFTALPMEAITFLWCIFNIILVGWIFLTFYEIVAGHSFFTLPIRSRWIIGFFSIIMCSRSILYHLDLAQANLLAVSVAVLGLKMLNRRKQISAGICIAISAVLKFITFPLSILFLARRDTRILTGIAVGSVIGLLIPALLVGFSQNLLYIDYWVREVVLSHDVSQSYHWSIKFNFSLEAQLYRYFSYTAPFEHEGQYYYLTIIELPKAAISILGKAALGLMALSILFYGFCYRKSSELVGLWGGAALAFSLMPILSTVTQKHYFVAMLPAQIYVVYLWFTLGLNDKWFRGLVVASFVAMNLPVIMPLQFLKHSMDYAGGLLLGVLLLSGAVFRAAGQLSDPEQKVTPVKI